MDHPHLGQIEPALPGQVLQKGPTHEADLGNGWEDVGTYPEDPPELHEQALRMGVNLYVYAVTSGVGR